MKKKKIKTIFQTINLVLQLLHRYCNYLFSNTDIVFQPFLVLCFSKNPICNLDVGRTI